jgi:hypothetical protein
MEIERSIDVGIQVTKVIDGRIVQAQEDTQLIALCN